MYPVEALRERLKSICIWLGAILQYIPSNNLICHTINSSSCHHIFSIYLHSKQQAGKIDTPLKVYFMSNTSTLWQQKVMMDHFLFFLKYVILLLTRDVPVSIFQRMEVVHELSHRNPEGLEQTCVLKQPIRNLGDATMRKTHTTVNHLDIKSCILEINSFFHHLH